MSILLSHTFCPLRRSCRRILMQADLIKVSRPLSPFLKVARGEVAVWGVLVQVVKGEKKQNIMRRHVAEDTEWSKSSRLGSRHLSAATIAAQAAERRTV